MTRRRIPVIGLVSALVVATGPSCAGPERATRPDAGDAPALAVAEPSPNGLLVCPGSVPRYVAGVVTPALGGTVAVGGFSITVPPGGVSEPQTIVLTVPQSAYLEVDIRVEGQEHFVFQAPATVTLDYSRCGVSSSELGRLTAWYIDGATKALLENMGGVDDRPARRLTFSTPHLSGYSIANRTDPAPGEGSETGDSGVQY